MAPLSSGQVTILETIFSMEPVTFTELKPRFDMCSDLLSSHLTRLKQRGMVSYQHGRYTVTNEGKKAIHG
jgi:predicted transcriptional regulator